MNVKKMKNLFLRQSYLDSWTDYESSLTKPSFIKWDYLVLTASNEEQARTYREQIDYRLKQGRLPADTHYAVLPDPEGKRVGSGGATLHVLNYIAEREREKGKRQKEAGKISEKASDKVSSGTSISRGCVFWSFIPAGTAKGFLSIPPAESCFLLYQGSFRTDSAPRFLMNS